MAIHLKNASTKGVKHFQRANGLDPTGRVDSATLRKQRIHNKNARQKIKVKPKRPGAPPKPQDPYEAQVKAAVRTKYRPQRQAIAGEIRASRQQQRNAGTWYDDYVAETKAASARAAQLGQDNAAQIGQIADRSGQVDRTNRQQMIADMRADAATRGASVDPTLDATGVQAEAARRVGLDESAAASLRTGANQANYLGDVARIGVGRKMQAKQGEVNRRRNLRIVRRDLKREGADYGLQVRTNLETTAFNQAATAETLDLKRSDLKARTRQQKIENRLARDTLAQDRDLTLRELQQKAAKTDLDYKNYKLALRIDKKQRELGTGPYERPGTKKPAKKAETQSSRDLKREINNTIGDYRAKRNTRDKKGRVWTLQRIHADMLKHGVPRDVANAALDLVAYGRLSRPNIAALKRAGVRIPREWR
jgi:hypothetical protein